MRRPAKTAKTAKRVTKSVRLTEAEAAELAQRVAGTAYAEAALLRQWVLSGMQHVRLSETIHAY